MIGMEDAWLLPAIPAAAFAVLALFRNALPRKGDWLGIAAILASFLLFFPVLADLLGQEESLPFSRTREWFSLTASR
jgi:NADH:ubiquinone oxidoreductase subunit 5 (subunit L)/multisubunit Na+/H+ antiporter MnhA subunit